MIALKQRKIFEYKQQTLSQTKEQIFALKDLLVQYTPNSEEKNSIWYYVNSLVKFLSAVGQDKEMNFFAYEQQAIALFDKELVKKFIAGLSELGESLNKEKIRILLLTLDKEFNKKDQNSQQQFMEVAKELYFQLKNICAVIGLLTPMIHTYSIEELKDFLVLEKKGQYDLTRLLRTIVEATNSNEDRKSVLNAALPWLISDERLGNDLYTWEEILLMSLLLNLAYIYIGQLPEGKQTLILQSYFYWAVVLDVPVREYLSNALYENLSPIYYAALDKVFFDAVSGNSELVPINIKLNTQGDSKSLSELFKDYIKENKDDILDENRQIDYIKNLYKNQPNVEKYIEWLKEVFNIYFHLKNADLIKATRANKISPEEVFTKDMTHLFAYFGIGESGADEIVKYFKQENPIVPLTSFLSQLPDVVKLDQDVQIDNCLEISEALQKTGLLPPEQDLIVYHEQDGKFHWNKEIISF